MDKLMTIYEQLTQAGYGEGYQEACREAYQEAYQEGHKEGVQSAIVSLMQADMPISQIADILKIDIKDIKAIQSQAGIES